MWRGALSGLGACLLGIGLARFSYAPLIPALIAADWFSPAATVYFGAANLVGYLVGAIAARALVRLCSPATALRGVMVMVTLSFFASADPLSSEWFFVWRFLSGFGGAVIMVVAAPTILVHVPSARRGRVGGLIFAGVGIGIALSGTLVPLLLRWGVAEAWLGLGVLSAVLTVAAWSGWPRGAPPPETAAIPPAARRGVFGWFGTAALLLLVEYTLLAVALVPHMVFLADFIARGLGLGVAQGGFYWTIYGIGAILGPLLAGRLSDWLGFRTMVRASLAVLALTVALLLARRATPALLASAFIVGALTPGTVPIFVGRTQEMVANPEHRHVFWAMATTCFALGLAVAGYFYSFLFAASGGDYRLLFAFGAGAAVLALGVDFIAGLHRRAVALQAAKPGPRGL